MSLLRSDVSLAVDKNRKIAAYNTTIWINSRLFKRDRVVIDFANQTVYVFDEKRSCARATKESGLKIELCLPPTSKRISSVVLGTGAKQSGLPVDVWEVPDSQAKIFRGHSKRLYTSIFDGCNPSAKS